MFFGKSQLHIQPLQTPAYLEFMCATYYLNPKNKIKAVKKINIQGIIFYKIKKRKIDVYLKGITFCIEKQLPTLLIVDYILIHQSPTKIATEICAT